MKFNAFVAMVATTSYSVGCAKPPPPCDKPPRPDHHNHAHKAQDSTGQHHSETVAKTTAVIAHDSIPSFGNNGNELRGIATASQGAKDYEVWRTSVAVGSKTPLHRHESEEVFIFLRGEGRAVIGEKEFSFKAPATVIAPENVPHQFFNTGTVPTDAIVVVGIGSAIYDADGNALTLPWRR